MKKGLTRRELLAGTGAAVGAAFVEGSAQRTALGAVTGRKSPLWGIAVDLARCAEKTGCHACIDACHAVHRVQASEDERHQVKWVWKEPLARVFPEQASGYETEAQLQTPVLVMCNHCTKSPCTKVCPTGATWRRSDGVVAMDEHRCIGCRYCMAACPYEARSFNWVTPHPSPSNGNFPARTAGVVEKCNLCVERLDNGQIPLCVETCASAGAGALAFGNLEDANSPLRQLLAGRQVRRRHPSLGTEPRIFYLV
jgi:molybdopterin-containing oxidoreductase family iron-sulfur binding subunit